MTACETCGGWNGGLGGFRCGCAKATNRAATDPMPHSKNPGILDALNHPNTLAVVARVEAATNRATAENAAAIADGERRRDASLDSLDDYRLLLRLRRAVREVASDTGLEPVEAVKTSGCHELLKALVERS